MKFEKKIKTWLAKEKWLLMAKDYLELFGNIAIPVHRCDACGRESFVIQGEMACCGAPHSVFPESCKRRSIPRPRRAHLSQEEKNRQLALQKYKCFYCNNQFGEIVIKSSRVVILKAVFDHFIPYSLTQNNYPSNFVAACNVCNLIKSNYCFDTVDEAVAFIRNKWIEKEIELAFKTPPIPLEKEIVEDSKNPWNWREVDEDEPEAKN